MCVSGAFADTGEVGQGGYFGEEEGGGCGCGDAGEGVEVGERVAGEGGGVEGLVWGDGRLRGLVIGFGFSSLGGRWGVSLR